MTNEMEEWLKTRPEVIQQMARAYPPGQYKMSDDAPYGYTCPGTLVTLEAYNEGGTIKVSVAPEDVLPAAIAHAKALRPDFTVPSTPVGAYVSPQYLIPLNS